MTGQVNVTTIEVKGQLFTMTRPGYYYTKVDGGQKRISKDEWESALEVWNREQEHSKADVETEKNFNKETKKRTRRSKDIAFEYRGITLTAKQVAFIKRMPEDDFYERGLESSLWIDVFCDTVADTFSKMAVGAMVSTLKEKGLIYVASDRVNGKQAKWMAFTDAGKQVAMALGLE